MQTPNPHVSWIWIWIFKIQERGWRDGSEAKAPTALPEGLNSIPGTHIVADRYPELQFQGIQGPPLTSTDNHADKALTHIKLSKSLVHTRV